ncbi:ABC transporter permease [Cytobacillus sp. Hm23]
MITILKTKFRLLMRKPWTYIIMTAVCMLIALFIGKGTEQSISVPVYSDMSEQATTDFINELKKSDAFSFNLMSKEELNEIVAEGKAEAGVILKERGFDLIIAANTENQMVIKQYVQQKYINHMQKQALIVEAEQQDFSTEPIVEAFNSLENNQVFTVNKKYFHSSDAFLYDANVQGLFGSALFFVIFTIAINVSSILQEKKDGVWDRMILSPVRKWEMYVGNLMYTFLAGYFQVVIIFLVFRYLTNIDFNGAFWKVLLLLVPYVFSIVALSVMLTGFVKNIQHFNALIPIVSVSMAMISGAYWPIEIVTSEVLLAISKVLPLTYGMELLKGAVIYDYSMSDFIFPISILCLMGVLMMGVGINFIERRQT